jgi:hypothetical protein
MGPHVSLSVFVLTLETLPRPAQSHLSVIPSRGHRCQCCQYFLGDNANMWAQLLVVMEKNHHIPHLLNLANMSTKLTNSADFIEIHRNSADSVTTEFQN